METSYVLADIHDLSPVFAPLRTTQRIKYSCFDVSQNLLVFGASSGGLYVFKREPCSFLQLLPNQEGAIVNVTISPDEKLFAFASIKGIVCVLEKNSTGLGARRIFTSSEHVGANVTAFQWNGQSNELFIGDHLGRMSVISLLPFMMKNMFNPPSCIILALDSQIVQMDWQADILLVSTLSRSYICDISKERYRQIGVKLRDGEYGSCFMACGDIPLKTPTRTEAVGGRFVLYGEGETVRENKDLHQLKAFCARPGSRLWEVKVDGTVLNTHQFKQALAIPPTPIIKVPHSTDSSQECDNESLKSTNNQEGGVVWNSQSFNFCKLFVLAKKYLFTYKKDGIYVFDPEKASVVMWSNDITDIIDAKIVKDTIYIRTSLGNTYSILFAPLEKFLIRLYLRKHFNLCAKLCEANSQYLIRELPSSSKLYLLADLGTKLSNVEATERILPLLQEISKFAQESRSAQKLESGIFVVENRYFLSKEESESSIPELPQVRRAERLKDKSRSLSVSPDRSRRKKKMDKFRENSVTHRSDSASSLPELSKKHDKNSSGSDSTLDGDNPGDFSKQKIDNRSSEDNHGPFGMKKSFSRELFTTFESSPETIQALKEIGQTVSSKITSSTKTLKEKWQVLEEKILGSETTPEPLDIRTSDYVKQNENIDLPLKCEEEIVFNDASKTDKSMGKKRTLPDININNVIDALQQLTVVEENNKEERRKLSGNLFDAILVMYNCYVHEMFNGCDDVTLESDINVNTSTIIMNSKINMKYFLVKWAEKSFPFEECFSSDVLSELSQKLHCSLKNSTLVAWLQDLVPVMEYVENLQLLNVVYSKEAIKLDSLLSRFLFLCSDLLQPHLILQCIKETSLECYYYSFCTVLDKYQAGALQQVAKERSVESSCWQWPLPLRLNAMYFMLQMNQIETCYVMGNNIDLYDVWYLMLRVEESQQSKSSMEHLDNIHIYYTFLMYLDRAPDMEMIMQNVLKNNYLLSFTTVAFEKVNEKVGASCKCGFPFPIDSKSQVQFSEIGQILSNHLWQTNHDRHQRLCERVPVLWKQMLQSAPRDGFKSVLPLLVQLGDFSLLEPLLPCKTIDVWKQLLDMVSTVRSGHCLKCGLQSIPAELTENVSLSTVGALVVKNLGPKSALDLLSQHSVTSGTGALNEKFYKLCIFSTIVESYNCDDLQSDLVDLVLACEDSLDKKPLVSNELGKKVAEALAQDLAKAIVPVPVAEAEAEAEAEAVGSGGGGGREGLEEDQAADGGGAGAGAGAGSDHHWGCQLDLRADACPRCGLPLGSPGLLDDAGLALFRCGHAFHAVCLRHRPPPLPPAGCLVCCRRPLT